MIDDEIRTLLEQPPDRSLDALEGRIWAGVAERERGAALARRIVVVQAMVLVAALVASAVAGRQAGNAKAAQVDVFSPRMSLSPAVLLGGDGP